MNKQECGRLLAVCQASYPSHPTSDPQALATAWLMTLGHLPYPALEWALSQHLRSSKWFPAPSELIEAVAAPAVVPPEGEAWGMVVAHVKTGGPGTGLMFDGPEAVREAVEQVGGWWALRHSERPERDREAFGRAYADIRRRYLADPDLGPRIARWWGFAGESLIAGSAPAVTAGTAARS